MGIGRLFPLNSTPACTGDMLKDPQLVYEKAEEMAEMFRARIQQAQEATQEPSADLMGPIEDQPFVY